jgi:26S proteasome non-ATPase regulatory subunit 9
MNQIEQLMHALHAETKQNSTEDIKIKQLTLHSETIVSPFLKVDIVSNASPAQMAGLEVGDLVIEFGSISKQNAEHLSSQQLLQAVGELVRNSENKPLFVSLQRNGVVVKKTLTPKKWEGKGLLGCHLILSPN